MENNERSEAARILGKIKTYKKAMSSRLNGTKPCHEGKQRGRPKGSKNKPKINEKEA